MKKKILSIILVMSLLFSLMGCGTAVEKENKGDDYPMFVCVETTSIWKIVYHKETKVMYSVSNGLYNEGTFTLLVDADGKPMLWEK